MLDFNEDLFNEEITLNKIVYVDLQDEIVLVDPRTGYTYRLASNFDRSDVEDYLGKYVHILADFHEDNTVSITYCKESDFLKEINLYKDKLLVDFSTIEEIEMMRSIQSIPLFHTLQACLSKQTTNVERLNDTALQYFTNWLKRRVKENINNNKDKFENIYLPNGNLMNETIYRFIETTKSYSKESNTQLAHLYLYLNTERGIELNKTYDEMMVTIKKYPMHEKEMHKLIHYLYGFIQTNHEHKNILYKGSNSETFIEYLKELSNDLNIPVIELSLSSFGDGGDLVGHNPTYNGAMMGRLAESYLKINTTSAIIILKGLDEVNVSSKNHSGVLSCLHELLNTRRLSENFLRQDIDVTSSIFVGTCIDDKNLNTSIAHFFYPIEEQKRTLEDTKQLIAQEIITLLNKNKLNIHVNDKIIDTLAHKTMIDPFHESYKKDCMNLITNVINTKNEQLLQDINLAMNFLNDYSEQDEFMNIYTQYYEYYPNEIKHKIENLFIERKRNDMDLQKACEEKLNYLIHCHAHTHSMIDIEKVKQRLNETHCGLTHVKEALLNTFVQYNSNISNHLMFVSSQPGLGKTSIALDACKASQLNVIHINCAQLSSLDDLYGDKYHPGYLLSKIKEIQTMKAPILLDEFEKCDVSIQNSLLNLTDTSNASFYSPYLECNVQLEAGFMICTVNYLDKVSDALKDRFKILEFKPYDIQTKKEIIQTKLLKKYEQYYHQTLSIDSKNIDKYLSNHPFYSIREIEIDVSSAIAKAIRNSSNIEFDTNYHLETKITKNTTNMLGVLGNMGCVTKLECIFDDKDSLKGNCKERFQEQFEIVCKHMRASHLLEEYVFMNVYGNPYPKDGSSAGLAMVASILSTKYHLDISNYAFTGEITLMGNVEKIGGLYYKLLAAKQAGIQKVFVPFDNQKDVEEMKEDLIGLEIIYVKNTTELIKKLGI